MLSLRKIAVTGGLACGKSLVCRFFQELGAYVVSADEIVHQLLSPKTDLGQQVIRLIGTEIVIDDQIDRAQIAKKVFNQPKLLKSLEQITHPAVSNELKQRYQEAQKNRNTPLFVAEIPLLFEAGFEPFFDSVIAVVADQEICKKRFRQATGYGPQEYAKRSGQQLSAMEKARRADFIIYNNGSQEEVQQAVEEIYHCLLIM